LIRTKIQYNDDSEIPGIVETNSDKVLIEYQNHFDGKYLIFVDKLPPPSVEESLGSLSETISGLKSDVSVIKYGIDIIKNDVSVIKTGKAPTP
jgi:recombinational DNA repair protein RecR